MKMLCEKVNQRSANTQMMGFALRCKEQKQIQEFPFASKISMSLPLAFLHPAGTKAQSLCLMLGGIAHENAWEKGTDISHKMVVFYDDPPWYNP